MTQIRLAIIPIILLLSVQLISCDSAVYEGTLSVRGNEPHIQLVLVTADGKAFELTGPRLQELRRHQYKTVAVHGKITYPAAGPGFPAKVEVDHIIRLQNR